MFSFKKKNIQSQGDDGLKDQMFFHDLINQTHGLLLFLNQKNLSGQAMDSSEVKLIEKEIKTLQSLIRDHYDFQHKNLVQTFDWVPFSYAKLAFNNLFETYLDGVEIKLDFNLEKNLEEHLIYYPTFYRVLNNIVKNISESKTTSVTFSFSLNEKGFFLETKNLIGKSSHNCSEYLSHAILDEKVTPIKSLGLDSIHHQATESGGDFSFEIIDHTWVNKLFLPTKHPSTSIKSDKNAA